MKLTPEHIDELYRFTRQHFVEWYDLQTELVDHLANDIETIWEENPNLSFREAKKRAFKKFGIFGFQDVIEKKQRAMEKYYWKVFWKAYKDYLKPPKILLILLSSLTLYTILHLTKYQVTILLIIFFGLYIFPLEFGYRYTRKLKRRVKKTGKKWLVDETIRQSGWLFLIFIQIPLNLLRHLPDSSVSLSELELILTSLGLSLFAVFVYVLVKIVPPKLEEEMCNLYPKYKDYLKA